MYTIGAVADLIKNQATSKSNSNKSSATKGFSGTERARPVYTKVRSDHSVCDSVIAADKRLPKAGQELIECHNKDGPSRKPKRKKKANEGDFEKESDVAGTPSPKRKKSKRSVHAEEVAEDVASPPPPKRKTPKRSLHVEGVADDVEYRNDEGADDGVTSQELPVKRKKKKRNPNISKSEDSIDPAREDAAPDSSKEFVPESPDRQARTVFVGNVPASATKKDLRRFFTRYGTVENVRFRSAAPARASISKKVACISKSLHASKQNLNGYVVFKEKSSVAKALGANGSVLLGNHIRVDKAAGAAHFDERTSVFVGNLPHEVQDEQLWECFSECGRVQGVRLVRDKITGMGKGFGFVTFKTRDEASLALEMSGREIGGRRVRVVPVSKHQPAKKAPQQSAYSRRKAKQRAKGGDLEPSTDFRGTRAERLLKKKKLKKLIKSKKQHKQQNRVFGFGTGKAAGTKKKAGKKHPVGSGLDHGGSA